LEQIYYDLFVTVFYDLWVRISGIGTYKYKNGSQYNGEYQEGSKHGKGICTHSDGTKFAQVWEYRDLKKEEKI